MPGMFKPRPSALALIAVLVIGLTAASGSRSALARAPSPEGILVADPAVVCQPGQLPTKWNDEYHPPQTIRVLRSKGPNAGGVDVVNFYDYVGVVLRAEYSTGLNKPPLWMRVGAITVKQYAWYKTMFWGGGRTVSGICWDVKDTTADQIYKPEKWDPNTNTWIAGNVPTPANLLAMDETWHMSLRKWMTDKSKSRLFLTGYRSGKQRSCGSDSTGFKIMQKGLRDCGVKGLTLEETLREFLEPNLLIVDTRGHDILGDGGSWFGDLGVLTAAGNGDTQWRLYGGTPDSFDQAAVGTFSVTHSSINAQATGDINFDGRADLVMLVNGGATLLVARATGTGYATPVATALTPAADRLLVDDFDGDLLADVGLVRSTGSQTAELKVMRGQSNGTLSAPSSWWSGPLDVSQDVVMAGDTNGDGKADLITRNGTACVHVGYLGRELREHVRLGPVSGRRHRLHRPWQCRARLPGQLGGGRREERRRRLQPRRPRRRHRRRQERNGHQGLWPAQQGRRVLRRPARAVAIVDGVRRRHAGGPRRQSRRAGRPWPAPEERKRDKAALAALGGAEHRPGKHERRNASVRRRPCLGQRPAVLSRSCTFARAARGPG